MFKSLFSAVVIALLFLSTAAAKSWKLPNEEFPIATIDIPESWEPEEINNGVAGTSDDGAVYLSVVAVGSDKGVKAELDNVFAMLKDHDVELDQATKKESKFKLNGLDAEEMVFQGKDEDGAASVSITFVTIKDKLLVITYWVSTEEEKKHQDEVSKIIGTLKAS